MFPLDASLRGRALLITTRCVYLWSVRPRCDATSRTSACAWKTRRGSGRLLRQRVHEVLPLDSERKSGRHSRKPAQSQPGPRALVSACASTCARAIRVSADSVDRVEPPAAELYSLARRRRAIWPALGSLHLPLSRGPSISVPPAPASTSQHGRGLSGPSCCRAPCTGRTTSAG